MMVIPMDGERNRSFFDSINNNCDLVNTLISHRNFIKEIFNCINIEILILINTILIILIMILMLILIIQYLLIEP